MFFFVSRVEAVGFSGRECRGEIVSAMSIQLCVFFVSQLDAGGDQGGNVRVGV